MSIVTTQVEWVLWQDAQKHDEWATTKFWEHILQKVYPAADGWVVSSQQPPTREKSDRRRVETTVEILLNGSLQKLVIKEAKKHKASQTEIEEVEAQAYQACLKYLKHSQRSEMYAMTVVGTRARLWIAYQSQDYLEPFVPGSRGLAAIEEYIEANSTDGYLLMGGLEHMKDHNLMPPGKSQILKSLGSPEPSHAALPGADMVMTHTATASTLPAGAHFVDLQVEDDCGVYHFWHGKDHYKVSRDAWKPGTTTWEGTEGVSCVFYTGMRSEKHFWAWSLDGCKPFKGKGKGN